MFDGDRQKAACFTQKDVLSRFNYFILYFRKEPKIEECRELHHDWVMQIIWFSFPEETIPLLAQRPAPESDWIVLPDAFRMKDNAGWNHMHWSAIEVSAIRSSMFAGSGNTDSVSSYRCIQNNACAEHYKSIMRCMNHAGDSAKILYLYSGRFICRPFQHENKKFSYFSFEVGGHIQI